MQQLSEPELDKLYSWISSIPLSRPKKNLARDFSDGVLMTDLLGHYFSKLVKQHQYSLKNSTESKIQQWNLINQRIFKKIGLNISKQLIQDAAKSKLDAIENILFSTMQLVDKTNSESFELFNDQKPSENNQEDKDKVINELQLIIEALELTVKKQEILIDLKDKKIQTLQNKKN